MKESLSQSQELKQQQRLTPMQVQFVRMLEMTAPELEGEVKRSLDEMPALDTADRVADTAEHPTEDDQFNESAEQIQLADYRTDDDIPSYRLEANNYSADDERYEPVAVNDELSLIDSLTEQLSEFELSDVDQLIARYIIGNLDDNGYLKRDINAISDDIAIQQSLEVTVDHVKAIWQLIRSLDPAGVGAIDLRDCLLLQIKRKAESDSTSNMADLNMAQQIVAHYFDLFSKKHYDKLVDALGITNSDLRRAVDIIRQLNPKPGNAVSESAIERSSRMIVPEFSVDADNGRLTLTLLNNIPELSISASFADDSAAQGLQGRRRDEALTFIKMRRDEAAAFIKTIQMRQQTLYNVAAAIVKIQSKFFLSGNESDLKPMILKDIAALTGYDLSVISRATASKYIMTQWGIFPLKYFFNEKPQTDDDTSRHEITEALRQIIVNEDKSAPLSDEELTDRLNAKGYNLARRTVSKYRERLGLPVARLRKEITD